MVIYNDQYERYIVPSNCYSRGQGTSMAAFLKKASARMDPYLPVEVSEFCRSEAYGSKAPYKCLVL